MSGYLGTKAVLLSTTAASVGGDSTIGGDLTVDTNTLYVDSTNNRVGVGTASPSNPFQVGTSDLIVDSSGNVGIGVVPDTWASTGKAIQLGGTGHVATANQYAYFGSNYYYNSGWKYTTSSTAAQYRQDSGSHQWLTASSGTADAALTWSERMRIDSNGNITFGSFNASGGSVGVLFDIGGGTSETEIQTSVNGTATRTHYKFINNNGAVGTITTSGTSTAYNTSSDHRLKENVTDVTDGITRVKQLEPKRFNFIADADTTVDGFLAHQAQAVVPEAVTGTQDAMRDEEYEVTPAVLDEDGNEVTPAVMGTRSVPVYQGIDQSKLVPLLTAALKEAITKIETLETEMTSVKARLDALEGN